MADKKKATDDKVQRVSKSVKLLRIWMDAELMHTFKMMCYRNRRSMTSVLKDFMKLYSKGEKL